MENKISILMGIYNCSKTLPEAIDSILAQTYSNWELIMCDDGSSDDTYKVAEIYVKKYPEKMILLKNHQNMGLNYTLNQCLEAATGEYVARMDGDDISLPERFEKEMDFLDKNPQFAIISTPMIYFDEKGEWGKGTAIKFPEAEDFVAGTPFCHAPCMVRTTAIRAVGGYSANKHTLRAEDYNLWFRMYEKGFKGGNLEQPLYKMRDDMAAYHRRRFRYCLNEAYVRFTGYRMLKLPLKSYRYVFRPILVGVLPKRLYLFLHCRKKS